MNRPDHNEISRVWASSKRWSGIERLYSSRDVVRLRGSIDIEYSLARAGAERLWKLLKTKPYVQSMAATSGLQALQQVQAGLEAINVSGAAVAADANDACEMYPDEGLYPVSSVPNVVRTINNAFRRADQIQHSEGKSDTHWFAPIKADGEAGFGGVLNTFELMKAMIDAGAAAVSFEDQLPSAKKCGHLGGKVLVPTSEFVQKLVAARFAADVLGVPTILIARTDARNAELITSEHDPRDRQFLTGQRTKEGFFVTRPHLEAAISRCLACAPYVDLLWYETSEPNLGEAREFAAAIHATFPDKMFYYNCSSSFNWKKKLSDAEIASFQPNLGKLGYKFQNCSRVGLSSMYLDLFRRSRKYRDLGVAAYAALQDEQQAALSEGYHDWKHHSFVGTGYFDDVARTIDSASSTTALTGSTEESQF
jgi:isocitrate lyase